MKSIVLTLFILAGSAFASSERVFLGEFYSPSNENTQVGKTLYYLEGYSVIQEYYFDSEPFELMQTTIYHCDEELKNCTTNRESITGEDYVLNHAGDFNVMTDGILNVYKVASGVHITLYSNRNGLSRYYRK